jgi:hypothetical protein
MSDHVPEIYRPIPVEEASRISREFAKDWVIVLAGDYAHGKIHRTTFAVEAAEKVKVAELGDAVAVWLGFKLTNQETHEDFRVVSAAEHQKMIDDLRAELLTLKISHNLLLAGRVGPDNASDQSSSETGREDEPSCSGSTD